MVKRKQENANDRVQPKALASPDHAASEVAPEIASEAHELVRAREAAQKQRARQQQIRVLAAAACNALHGCRLIHVCELTSSARRHDAEHPRESPWYQDDHEYCRRWVATWPQACDALRAADVELRHLERFYDPAEDERDLISERRFSLKLTRAMFLTHWKRPQDPEVHSSIVASLAHARRGLGVERDMLEEYFDLLATRLANGKWRENANSKIVVDLAQTTCGPAWTSDETQPPPSPDLATLQAASARVGGAPMDAPPSSERDSKAVPLDSGQQGAARRVSSHSQAHGPMDETERRVLEALRNGPLAGRNLTLRTLVDHVGVAESSTISRAIKRLRGIGYDIHNRGGARGYWLRNEPIAGSRGGSRPNDA